MILSNTGIQEALESGHLVIDPAPALPPEVSGADGPFNTSSVDLCLGDEISEFIVGAGFTIDLTQGGFRELHVRNSTRVMLTRDQPFCLAPNRLVLGKTRERVCFPLHEGQCLAARVEGKSSYARCGLLVHFTAPTIHAGFEGTITLELINLGPLSINLHAGMPICQLVIEQVSGRPQRMDSQFQGQSMAGGD